MPIRYALIYFTVKYFPDSSKNKTDWSQTMTVKCGWNKKWDPPSVPDCVDPRICLPPPPRTERIYGSYENDPVKSLEVGATYWYACRNGKRADISTMFLRSLNSNSVCTYIEKIPAVDSYNTQESFLGSMRPLMGRWTLLK